MFQPFNSPYVNQFFDDAHSLIVLRLFLYVAIPTFILVRFAAENFARKSYKDLKKRRAFRIGRRLMLSCGFVLTLQALLTIMETIPLVYFISMLVDIREIIGLIIVTLLLSVAQIIIGIIGYKVWKDPTKRMIKVGFVSGLVLFGFSIVPMFFLGSDFSSQDLLITIDSIVSLVITIGYIIGSIIVRANYKLGLNKPQPKA